MNAIGEVCVLLVPASIDPRKRGNRRTVGGEGRGRTEPRQVPRSRGAIRGEKRECRRGDYQENSDQQNFRSPHALSPFFSVVPRHHEGHEKADERKETDALRDQGRPGESLSSEPSNLEDHPGSGQVKQAPLNKGPVPDPLKEGLANPDRRAWQRRTNLTQDLVFDRPELSLPSPLCLRPNLAFGRKGDPLV